MNVSNNCEHTFWSQNLPIDEPIAAFSGLFMSLIALGAPIDDPPLQYCIARASLVLCGLGTFVYHALGCEQMDTLHLNGIIFDGVSMALVTVNIFLLYLNPWMKRRLMVVSVGVMIYLFFWVLTNDLLTFRYLCEATKVNGISLISIGIQYPSFVLVYVYILWQVKWSSQHWPLWVCLAASLAAWCANEFACTVWRWFFIGHVIWHIGIGYVAHYLTVLGAADTYGLKQTRKGFFLKLERVQCGKELDVSEIFNHKGN